ncbi:MAG TPA: dihydrodipicolinate synthase family protein [Segeticoccus sp.]|uniref:dihydrodipicolinate synthase family protein n=1 Tax=Segeticoccus sp. TaxID=2706531 RepID=UPI002D80E60D|nr:dihydrodipicolinate synthase family protein [Segeticoccus sp.]HET8600599.1 dihydrodipicolinate synthase family protein [Segeticoccus sp.]
MTTRTPRYTGVVPPLVTPLTDDGALDVPSLERLVAAQLEAGVSGLFALGSSGETIYLTDEVRDQVLEVIVRTVAGQVPVMAGCIEPSTDRVVVRARRALALGADALVATAPFYALVSDSEIDRHFRLVRGAVDLPLLAYDLPVCVHTKLSPAMVTTLAQDGVIDGVKDSSGNDVEARQTMLALEQHPTYTHLTGHEVVVDAMLLAGCDGVVPGLGNVDPDGYVRLYTAAREGRWADAKAEQDRLARLFRIVAAADRSTAGGNAAGVGGFKTALALLGVIRSNQVSPPLRRLDEDERKRVAVELEQAGLR